ncbi:hypothetical protein JOC74_002446 [Bacillus capparidis]|nr:hypothetical protein [Bacillus capparidis]
MNLIARRTIPFFLISLFALEACATNENASRENREETTESNPNKRGEEKMESQNTKHHPYVGMWVTADGYIRQELLPNGRYDEARGTIKSAYTGSYTIKGNHIDYVDDTGFTADGEFRDDVLYHAGMVFYREKHK